MIKRHKLEVQKRDAGILLGGGIKISKGRPGDEVYITDSGVAVLQTPHLPLSGGTGLGINQSTAAQNRAMPTLPPIQQTPHNDLTVLDAFGIRKLLFTDVPMLSFIPTDHEATIAMIYVEVADAYTATTIQSEKERLWMLFHIVHRLFLRAERAGDSLNSRLQAYRHGDWKAILAAWVEAVAEGRKAPRSTTREAKALAAMSRGRVGAAVRICCEEGPVNLTTPGIIQQLEKKQLRRTRSMPGELLDPAEDISLDLRKIFRRLRVGAGVGPDGIKNSYLISMAKNFDNAVAERVMWAFETLGEDFVSCRLPAWCYTVFVETQQLALPKPIDPMLPPPVVFPVRPVGMGSCLRRALTAAVIDPLAAIADKLVFPIQTAWTKGAARLRVHTIRLHLEAFPDHIAAGWDVVNAHNSAQRRAAYEAIRTNPDFRHAAQIFWATYSPESVIHGLRLLSSEGFQQGDCVAGLAYCLLTFRHLQWADTQLRAVNGRLFANQDDSIALGPAKVVITTLKELQRRLRVHCNLRANPSKDFVYCPNGPSVVLRFIRDNPSFSSFVPRFIDLRDPSGTVSRAYGFSFDGVPFGDDRYIVHQLELKWRGVKKKITKVRKTFGDKSKQGLLTALLQCLLPLLHHEMQLVNPETLRPILRKFDLLLLEVFKEACALGDLGLFGLRRIRLPRSLGGFGLRCQEEVAHAAFTAALCETLYRLADHDDVDGKPVPGFHPALADHILGPSGGNTPLEFFIHGSGLVSATQHEERWVRLAIEVAGDDGCMTPGSGPLTCVPEAAGMSAGRPVAKLQLKLTRQRELVAHELLSDDIVGRPGDDPERMAFMSVDSYSAAFMGLPPTVQNHLSNRELPEVVAMFLGLISPACKAHVGHKMKGGRRLDDRGNNLLTTSYSSEWHDAHEIMQEVIESIMSIAGIPFKANPMSEFLPLVAQRDRFLLDATASGQRRSIRHVIIPDFTYEAEDRVSRKMSDIKRLYPGGLYSSAGAIDKQSGAVLVRQLKVHTDYHAAAAAADVTYNGLDPGTGGPISSYLLEFGQVQGWVFGAFGETSPHARELVLYASRRAGDKHWIRTGCDSPADCAAMHKNWFKRMISVASWRGLARLKLRNLGHALAGDYDRSRARLGNRRRLNALQRQQEFLWHGPENFVLGARARPRRQ